MAALTSAPLVVLFACSWIFVLCQETQELKETVKPGENATLQCRGHRGVNITVIKWIRTDLKSDDGYVFFFRDGRSYEIYQHESFCGRVELRDLKDGDASVILKNVNINDTGTYECLVRQENASELTGIVRLTVTDPGHTAGHKEGGDKEGGDKEGGNKEEGDGERNVRLKAGLSVGGILLVGGVVVVVFRKKILTKYRECKDNNSDQPAAPENVPMQEAEPADEN